jgi:hypothetical protein
MRVWDGCARVLLPSPTHPHPHPNFTNFQVVKNYFEFGNKEDIAQEAVKLESKC